MAERRLLDQYGDPVDPATIAALRTEISPVGGQFARPPFSGHLAFGINPERLGAIIRAADNGSTQEWFILAEEIEELYPHYAAALGKRKRQVVQLPITVMAADEKTPAFETHAELVRDWLRTDALDTALMDIADGIGKGFSVSEIIWQQEPGRTWPERLAYRPQRFFEFDPLDGQTIWLRSEKGFEPLLDHKFLVHRHPSKSGNIVRGGLTRMVAFLWCYASFTMKDWALFTQAYGLPIRLGKYGVAASDEDKRTLWRGVASIAGDVAAIIPDSMQIEFVSMPDKAAGRELYEKRMDWLDRAVSKLVLGGTAGMDAIAGGHAVGREHRQGEDDVEKFDANLLATAINRQIIQPMIAFTFGPQPAYPTVTIGRPQEIPLKDVVEAVADLGAMGFKVRAADLYERLQMTPPEDGEETVGGAPAPEPSPEIPHPAKPLPTDGMTQRPAAGSWLGTLLSRHVAEPDEVYEAMTQRLAADAAGAMANLTETVRHEFMVATDMRDLAHRLHKLNLPSHQFAEAMARGMAMAELAGQFSLVEELRSRR